MFCATLHEKFLEALFYRNGEPEQYWRSPGRSGIGNISLTLLKLKQCNLRIPLEKLSMSFKPYKQPRVRVGQVTQGGLTRKPVVVSERIPVNSL
ncbi:hypothetical protein EVAR_50836_1 [Eumeta japonica]|uniref:Uncharacterized protein n=1 Tax=Eumeta variegata TaxID=151549 RepID=A0A4C1XFW5_EUMVA|nr:hypothetical protein EVAR_50836_1 [Eumeta japonica]